MIKQVTLAAAMLAVSAVSSASVVGPFTGADWNILADDDAGIHNGQGTFDKGATVNGEGSKAHGGWRYDAEYLLYKYDAQTNVLSLGLQTGFDLLDNATGAYRSGDLALSFNGVGGYDFEYAIDFGSEVSYKDSNGVRQNQAADAAGLYSVNDWMSDTIHYNINGPLAMVSGNYLSSVSFTKGSTLLGATDPSGYQIKSYTSVMSFNLGAVGLTSFDVNSFSAYWTMSCGNDVITNVVPEPSVMLLLSTGLIGLFGGVAIRRKKNAA